MATRRKVTETDAIRRPPGKTPEARERQLVGLAVDLAEKQLRDGTASSQVITAILRLGTTTEKLQQQKLKHENELLQARAEQIASQARVEELYMEALKAMKSYTGEEDPPDYDEGA